MAELVRVDCSLITDWPCFHSAFARAFGYRSFYGTNNNAWIDCMTRLDEAFSEVQVETGQIVTLQLDGAGEFKERLPELLSGGVCELEAARSRLAADFVRVGRRLNCQRRGVGAPPLLGITPRGKTDPKPTIFRAPTCRLVR